MDWLMHTFKIILYFLNIFLFYKYICKMNDKNINKEKKNKFSLKAIIIFSMIMGIYSVICGNLSDRMRYGNYFSHDSYNEFMKSSSLGLYYFYNLLHLFTHNRYILFFAVAFVYFAVTLFAYNNAEEASPLVILLLGVSTYSVWGFYAFKQCFAVALVALSWSCYTKNQKKSCIISLLIAILFHESALIMIPVYLYLKIANKSNRIRIFVYIILILSFMFFKDVLNILYKIMYFVPYVRAQMSDYFDSAGNIEISFNFLTALKGLPFFIITLYAVIKRNKLKDKIKNYDNNIALCFFCSITYLMSIYVYWMWRFGLYLYFPVFIFFGQIINCNNKNNKVKLLKNLVVALLFAILIRYLIQCFFIYGGIY